MTRDYIESAGVSHYHVIATIEIRKISPNGLLLSCRIPSAEQDGFFSPIRSLYPCLPTSPQRQKQSTLPTAQAVTARVVGGMAQPEVRSSLRRSTSTFVNRRQTAPGPSSTTAFPVHRCRHGRSNFPRNRLGCWSLTYSTFMKTTRN